MAGLYRRINDPNFAAPVRGGTGANAGIGAPAPGRLPDQPQDDFDAAKLAGLLGMLQKKEQEGAAAPGAAPAQPAQDMYSTPNANLAAPQFMNDMANGVQGAGNVPIPQLPSDGYQLPQNVVPGADMTQGIMGAGGQSAQGMLSNIGNGVPVGGAEAFQAGVAAAPQVAAENPGLLDMIRNGWQGLTGLFSAGA